MSAKKSFDVRRKAPARKPEPKPAPRKRSAPRSRPAPRPSRMRPSTLAARRREEKKRWLGIYFVLFLVLVGAVIYMFWRPEIRIQEVVSEDASLAAIAKGEIEGTYFKVLPRDSIFFYPERDIRAAILDEHPEISALSISRQGLQEISIKTVSRSVAFWWCGTPENASATNFSCYEADAEGLIFRPAIVSENASSTPSGSTLRIYANLIDATSTPSYPLKARMESLESIPDVLRFVKSMKTLNVSPVSVAIRGDEADLFVPSSGRGTRITYVLGREESAAELAAAVFPNLNLTDGSIEYVDLRFSGKAYIKRRE